MHSSGSPKPPSDLIIHQHLRNSVKAIILKITVCYRNRIQIKISQKRQRIECKRVPNALSCLSNERRQHSVIWSIDNRENCPSFGVQTLFQACSIVRKTAYVAGLSSLISPEAGRYGLTQVPTTDHTVTLSEIVLDPWQTKMLNRQNVVPMAWRSPPSQ